MSSEKESLHIKFEGAAGPEVVIRHGDAEPIHVPSKLVLGGDFFAPAEFVKKRYDEASNTLDEYNGDNCHVYFVRNSLEIKLVAGEQERAGIIVTGTMKKNPFIDQLQINGSGHTLKGLLQLIRFKPHFFPNRQDHKDLVFQLQNVEVTTNTNIKQFDDRSGNKESSIAEKATTKLAGKIFDMHVPLFENEPPATIKLQIEVEPNNGTVLLYLISETFEEFYEKAVKALFDVQRATFEPFVIITV